MSLDLWLFLDESLKIESVEWSHSSENLNLHFHIPSNSVASEHSVQFSRSVVSDSLWPHGLQHTRFPCPSPTPGVYSTHVHWVGEAIQQSHHLLSLSPAFNRAQHQGLFQWVSTFHQVTKVLEFQLQHPMNIQDWLSLGLTGLISLQSKGLSKVFSNTTVQKHQFFGAQLSL